jgi:hypothetical protein
MSESLFQRAFAGGELAPSLAARADQTKYLTGLRTCRNWIVQRFGGVANRPGLRFVGETRDSVTTTFLLRYIAATPGDSVLIEAAPLYLRFYRAGALVRLTGVVAWNAGTNYAIGDIAVSGGVNYYAVKAGINHVPPNATFWYAMPSDILELPTPFGNAGFDWSQSGNVLTLTSPLVPPYELIYFGLTQWAIQQVSTAPAVNPPTALLGVAGVVGTRDYKYVVTSAAVDSFEESVASVILQSTPCGYPTKDNPNVLNWTAPVGAPAIAEYYVYLDPYENGTYGFIGTATGQTSFKDIGFTPDFAVTPPLPRILFTTTGNFPAHSTTYQQRRIFAATVNDPDGIFGSRVGFRSNFNISSPLQDDDAITLRIAGDQANPIARLLGLKTLDVLTDAGIWTIGQPKIPLTPANLPADQETYNGVGAVRPVVIGNAIIYVQARGSIVRDVRFEQEVEGLAGRDLSLYAAHLFDGRTIVKMDYQQTPQSIVWACRSDGTLLGLTYLREEEIWGWHRHDTGAGGLFEDVCVVPETSEDVVYVLVRRTIGGVFKRYIERLEAREILSFNADAFFVDAGLTYSGAPVASISGLSHLNGQVVAVVADGKVIYNGDPAGADAANFTVTAGTIPHVFAPAASIIHAGLAIRYSDLETLDLDVQGAAVRDKRKRVASVTLLLDASVRTFWAGPSSTRLVQVKLKPHETGLAGVPFTGQETIAIETTWGDYGRVFIRQIDPLPITILGILPNVDLGG